MQFHPTARPAFVRHVQARLARLRAELPPALPPGDRPITLEIGSGHGHFLTRFAGAHPDRFCLGIDILGRRLGKAKRKAGLSGLANLHFHQVEATELLECLPAEVRFREVFVLFPDPWPKMRHHKNRLMRPDFLAALAQRMAPGGRLYFRTDHDEYFATATAVIAQHENWSALVDAPWPFEEDTIFQQRAPAFQSLVAEVVRS